MTWSGRYRSRRAGQYKTTPIIAMVGRVWQGIAVQGRARQSKAEL